MFSKKIFAAILAAVIILSSFITFSMAVTSPQTLQLTGLDTTDREANLIWTSMPGTWKYNIYRSSTGDYNYSIVETTNVPYFKDFNLRPSTTYWYYIRAYSLNKSITYSNHIRVETKESTGTLKTVLGFTTRYSSSDTASYNSLVNNNSIIDQTATYTYTTDAYGNLTGSAPVDEIAYAKGKGIDTFALITNNFSGSVAKTILESSTNRQNLIDNISKVLKSNGYKGVNIDFEGVYSSNREQMTLFMSQLYGTLKPQGLLVTADLPAKTWDDPNNGWAGAYDYPRLANLADQIILMTYDEHYSGGAAGPVASIGWVKKVIDYAVTVIPRDKIMLGTAAYGYDWSSKGSKAYSIDGIKKLSQTYNRPLLWDEASKTPYLNYTDSTGVQHSVWFENSTSLSYKLDIVNSENLKGIAIWKLGLENQDYWATIRQKFNR